MKKLILFISFVFCFVFSFGQAIVPRSNGSLTVQDSNWFGGNSFRVPIFSDTTSANTRRPSLDSAGKVIFTRDINWFWGRQTSPSRKWVPFTSTNPLTPNCGNPNGYHLVTWDSLLYFDVTGGPYVLCCDNIPRSTNDTVIHLPDGDPDNPRIDAIILDQNGVNQIQGIPAANPALPQTDSCQIVLTYVLIAAGQTEPQNIVQTVIYDENDYNNGEWTNDSLSQVTMDTANTSHPVHLVKDDSVISYTTGGYMIWTAPSSIHLNDYSALKLYVRKTFNSVVRLDFAFYLDGVQATNQLFQSIPATGADFYTTIVIPISSFNILNTDEVNKLRIILTGSGEPIYIDWIQLQGGLVPPPNLIQGISSLSAGNNNIIIANVTNPTGPNAQINIPLRNQSPYTIFRQNSAVDSIPVFGKLDLSQTQFFVNTLPVNLLTGGMDGQYLTTVVSTPTWTTPSQDTTFVGNWLIRKPDPNSNNDTLYFGSPDFDSALLRFNTYLGLNGFFLNINDGANNLFVLDPVHFESVIVANNGSAASGLTANADFGGGNVNFTLSSDDGVGHLVSVIGNAIAKNLKLNADSIFLNSTLSGSSSGYVWTLADPLTGSGYWGVGGGTVAFNGLSNGADGTDSIELGGTLLHNTTINTDVYQLAITGTQDGSAVPILYVNNSTVSGGVAITAINASPFQAAIIAAGNAYGVSSTGNTGIYANGTAIGIQTESLSGGVALVSDVVQASTNSVGTVSKFFMSTSGTAANGLGGSIDLQLQPSTGGSTTSNQLIWKWIDATTATATSQFKITGLLSAASVDLFTANGDGSWQIRPITATAASAITPAEGMFLFVSNTNGTFVSIGPWCYYNGAWHAL